MTLAEPPNFPIHQYQTEIVKAIRSNQVVIVTGETGSGKSVMLPAFCREAGLCEHGSIVVTEPRRIAAVSLAGYAAHLDATEIGTVIGYAVRYRRNFKSNAKICYMTDGLLQAIVKTNPLLHGYAVVIIDEAHERSLSIDFLLGYLKMLLLKRKELKVIISSATLNTHLLSKLFPAAPVINVATRRFAVEVQYQPVVQLWKGVGIDSFIEGAIVALEGIVSDSDGAGDVLIFLPAVEDVNETVHRIRYRLKNCALAVLPLHGRLSYKQQAEVFKPQTGRKVVVATNIAETSITVPGITYVIDSGLVRMLRYDVATSLGKMPVEKIARSSAEQRAGRCGRTAEGTCIRLYSEQDFLSRPRFTHPEIKRVSLGGLILRMHHQKIVAPDVFPFPEQPARRALDDGYRQLKALGAIDHKRNLTPFGRAMAHFPLDPPVACMLLRAREYGVVHEVMVIAAALSATDPVAVVEGESSAAIRRLKHRESDFITLLNVWMALQLQVKQYKKSIYQAVRMFAEKYALYQGRLQEWQNAYHHLYRIYEELFGPPPMRLTTDAYSSIHKSLLSGLVGAVATLRSDNRYAGVNTDLITVATVSVTFGKRFPWLLFHELVETDKVYGVRAAKIEPKWIEELFRRQCTYRYEDPWYDDKTGEVLVREEVLFHGLVLVKNRIKVCSVVNRNLACRTFVEEALVGEKIGDHYHFIRHNRGVRNQIAELEQKVRKRLYGGNEPLLAFYEEHAGSIWSRKELNRALLEPGREKLLCATLEKLLNDQLPSDYRDYCNTITVASYLLPVVWRNLPESDDDGATITVPEELNAALPSYYWEWAIPVLTRKRVVILVNCITPRLIERDIDPAEVLESVTNAHLLPVGPWLDECIQYIERKYELVTIDKSALQQLLALPHVWPRVVAVNHRGTVVATFRPPLCFYPDRTATRTFMVSGAFAKTSSLVVNDLVSTVETPVLLAAVESKTAAHRVPVVVYHALVATGGRSTIQPFSTLSAATNAQAKSIYHLCEQQCAEELAWEIETITYEPDAAAGLTRLSGGSDLQERVIRLLLKAVLELPRELPVTLEGIGALVKGVPGRVPKSAARLFDHLKQCIEMFNTAEKRLNNKRDRGKFTGSEELFTLFTDELTSYADALFDEKSSYRFIERLPEFLEYFPARVDAAVLDPGAFRRMNSSIEACRELISRCLLFDDHCLTVQCEDLRIAIEQYRLDWVAVRHRNKKDSLTVASLNKQREQLKAYYDFLSRL